jgi:3-keto-disaccharide hydrolase
MRCLARSPLHSTLDETRLTGYTIARMKPLLHLIAVMFVCVGAPVTSHAAGPIPLFDGKTFKGWDGDTNWTWRIQDGAFVGGSLSVMVPRNEFIATTRSFTNFVLRLKFKLAGTNGFVNGGVQIRSERTETPPNEMSGYQLDMGDPEWWGCVYDESRRNKVMAKSDIAAINKVLKRQDWNEYVIRAEGRRIRASINGVQAVDYTESEEAIPQFGKIGLQVHGGGKTEAWYKDITIEELR